EHGVIEGFGLPDLDRVLVEAEEDTLSSVLHDGYPGWRARRLDGGNTSWVVGFGGTDAREAAQRGDNAQPVRQRYTCDLRGKRRWRGNRFGLKVHRILSTRAGCQCFPLRTAHICARRLGRASAPRLDGRPDIVDRLARERRRKHVVH